MFDNQDMSDIYRSMFDGELSYKKILLKKMYLKPKILAIMWQQQQFYFCCLELLDI
jgi:hypothetical protein